jgi:hypothetical protein
MKTASFGKRGGIPRAMQNPDDEDRIRQRLVIDGIAVMDDDPQAWSQVIARWAEKRKMAQGFEGAADPRHDPCRDRFGGFQGDIRPDFRQIVPGRIG